MNMRSQLLSINKKSEINNMKKNNTFFCFLIFFALGMLLFSTVSLAYIDPSTTSILIQIGAGVAIALGGYIKIYSKQIKKLFTGKGRQTDKVASLDSGEDGFDDSEFDIPEGVSYIAEIPDEEKESRKRRDEPDDFDYE